MDKKIRSYMISTKIFSIKCANDLFQKVDKYIKDRIVKYKSWI